MDVALIYPYFKPLGDRSIFRFPPLGLGYIASYLRERGVSVRIIDCTFLSEEEALHRVRSSKPQVIGIYCMVTLRDAALKLAAELKKDCEILIAGGPYPTVDPRTFLDHFDIVVIGEGEQTVLEIVRSLKNRRPHLDIPGVAYRDRGEIIYTEPRESLQDLDVISFPARDLFDNDAYRGYWRRRYKYTATSLISTRGCPYRCDFCSRSVFGVSYRERSARNVVDEIESVLCCGYDRIWFADDCFTLNRKRVSEICDEILRRNLKFGWECLSRADIADRKLAEKMKLAGCKRVFFGIESGDNFVLREMRKQITVQEAQRAVQIFNTVGIKVGAFFIVGYPGETEGTILRTIRFSTSLPLDYLSFTLPYPFPGTGLYEKVKDRGIREWRRQRFQIIDHSLVFSSPFSEPKLKFAIAKGTMQFKVKKNIGGFSSFMEKPLEIITDRIFKALR